MSKRRAKTATTSAMPRPLNIPRGGAIVLEVGFFLGFFLALERLVSPALLYQNADPAVFAPQPFRFGMFFQPGGWVEYVRIQILQVCQEDWLGALLATLLAWMICGAIRLLLRQATGTMPKVAHLVTAPVLFALLSQYDPAAMKLAVVLALALAVAAGYASISVRSAALRLPAAWLGAVIVYWLAGMGAVIHWAIAGIGVELAGRRPRRGLASFNLLLATGAALLVNLVALDVPFRQTLVRPDSRLLRFLGGAFGWGLVSAMVFLNAFPHRPPDDDEAARGTRNSQPFRLRQLWRQPAWRPAAWIICMAAGSMLAYQAFDLRQHQRLLLHHLALNRQWPEFLQLARVQNQLTAASRIHLLRALQQTGQLSEDLFAYPITKTAELLPGLDGGLEACPALGAVMLELGQVNQAEHFAHEALERYGDRPDLLRLLAHVNVLKGHPQAAAVFLNVLRQNPFHARRAAQALEQLEVDALLNNDSEIARYREVMVRTDYTDSASPTGTLMQQLLQTNPRNRMAFEFLMAHYLVSAQLDKFMDNLGSMQAFHYPAMPRHYAEAMVLAARLKKIPLSSQVAPGVTEDVMRRYLRFEEIVKQHKADLPTARRLLAPEFGNTYWFFFLFDATASHSEPVKIKG